MSFDLYGRTQSEPKQGFCFDCIDARERNQPRRLLQEGFEQVLHRPIETAPFIRWDEKAGLQRDAISSQRLTRSRRNGKETGL